MQPNFSASLSLEFQFKTRMVWVLKMCLLFLLPSLTTCAGCKKEDSELRQAKVEKLGCEQSKLLDEILVYQKVQFQMRATTQLHTRTAHNPTTITHY